MDEPSHRSRVLIVGPQPLMRLGIRTVVDAAPDLESIGEATSGGEALSLTPIIVPDVLVCDVGLPDMTGFEFTRRLRLQAPNTATVLLSPQEDDDAQFQAVKTGAFALVLNTVAEAELLRIIRSAARGERPIDEMLDRPAVASRVLSEFTALSDEAPQEIQSLFAPLSPREIEILEHICRGNTNKQIAKTLAISDQTVKNHVTSILKKLAVNDRTEAVVFSLRQGWIKIDGVV